MRVIPVPGHPLPLLPLLILLAGFCRCQGNLSASLDPAFAAGSLTPERAYTDSRFEARFTLLDDVIDQVEVVWCTWMVDDDELASTEATLDGGAGRCELDGTTAVLNAGDELMAVLTPWAGDTTLAPRSIGPVTLRPHPLMAVTENHTGFLALLDSRTGEVLQRVDLTLSLEESGLDATSAATNLVGRPSRVALSPGGDRILVGSNNYGSIWELDASTYEVIARHHLAEILYWFDYSLDGSTIFVTDQEANQLLLVDAATWEVARSLPTGVEPMGMAEHENGWLVVNHHGDALTLVFDLANGDVLTSMDVPTTGYLPHLHPDGETLWQTGTLPSDVQLYRLPGLESAGEAAVGDHPQHLAFTDGGATAFVANFAEGSLSRIDVATLRETDAVKLGLDPDAYELGSVAVLPRDDERWIYVANLKDHSISVVDARTMEVEDTWVDIDGPRWMEWIDDVP